MGARQTKQQQKKLNQWLFGTTKTEKIALTPNQYRQARELFQRGFNISTIAQTFNVPNKLIMQALRGRKPGKTKRYNVNLLDLADPETRDLVMKGGEKDA